MSRIRIQQVGKAYKHYTSRWARLREWLTPLRTSHHSLKWILQDINFEAQAGEAIGILGVNGAGKSTLLKLITGISKPTVGSIEITGTVAAILELGIGFHLDFTGRQNVFLAGQLLGLTTAELKARLPDIIRFAELEDYVDEPLRVYSSGMSVRLAFAVATAKRPDILIVDEALSVGDAYFQHKSFARIRQFQEQGTTLLLVSHDIAAVRGICSRSIWLDNGMIRLQGNSHEVVDAYFANLYSKQQNVVGVQEDTNLPPPQTTPAGWRRDIRQDFINQSNLRNDIQIFDFDEHAPRWGDGAAKIVSVVLTDRDETPFSWTLGGEEVTLTIKAIAKQDLNQVNIGFLVRDRLGQSLFGDSTTLTTSCHPRSVKKDQSFSAQFRFLMPILPQGAYSLSAAIAVGTQENHLISDWINQAVIFQSINPSLVNGLVGIPMHEVGLEIDEHPV